MLEHVINLLAQSAMHRHWTIDQVRRCIAPPVVLEQHTGIIEDRQLVAWASWAFVSAGKSAKFLSGDYSMQPEDWRSGDVLVFMDFVAPFGHAPLLSRQCRNLFPHEKTARWWRQKTRRAVTIRVGAE